MSEREETLTLDRATLTPVVVSTSASDASKNIFEAGEVFEPRIAVDRTAEPTLTGLVHFDDETEETRISVRVRRSTAAPGAIVVELTPTSDERVQIQLFEDTVFDAEASYEDPTQTVADLDDSDDEATWLQPGYVLQREDVDYIRSLVRPSSVRRYPKR